MAKSLDDLLRIKGVAAVGEFGLDGKLVAFKVNEGAQFPAPLAASTAQYTAAVTHACPAQQ